MKLSPPGGLSPISLLITRWYFLSNSLVSIAFNDQGCMLLVAWFLQDHVPTTSQTAERLTRLFVILGAMKFRILLLRSHESEAYDGIETIHAVDIDRTDNRLHYEESNYRNTDYDRSIEENCAGNDLREIDIDIPDEIVWALWATPSTSLEPEQVKQPRRRPKQA